MTDNHSNSEGRAGDRPVITGTISPDLFSETARRAAKKCQDQDKNKTTQIRRFYDELVMWNERVSSAEDRKAKYTQVAPYIKMICAKVAYAHARKYVTDEFASLLNDLIGQIDSPESLKHAKLFFEAFLGYKKDLEKKAEEEKAKNARNAKNGKPH